MHTGLDKTSPLWLSRVGAMYRILEHYEAALTAFKESEIQLGNSWNVLLQIGETYAGLKQFPSALEYLHKVKAMHSELIDTDTDYKSVYWDRILLPEGNYHRELKDNSAAIQCYQDILAQDVQEAQAYHADALAALFALWIEIGESDSIVSFLRGKRAEAKLSYWLGNIVGDRDDVHNKIIQAAKQSSAFDEVSQMYDEVIEPKVEPKDDDSEDGKKSGKDSEEPSELHDNLPFFRAVLNFHVSELHDEHEKGLAAWEKMVFHPSSNPGAYWVAYKARRLLARALLDKGVADPATTTYVTRLETLSRCNQENVRDFRGSQHDSSINLARLYLLRDDSKLADEEARALLRGVFDNWPEALDDPSFNTRFGVLAQVLAVFNLDDDAVAAWQALKPRQVKQMATEDGVAKVESPQDTPAEAVEDVAAKVNSPQDTPTDSPAPKAEAYICGYICDGCNTPWNYMLADCWDCKHCLCVQLCTPCHDKVVAEELSPLICSKDHDFLYLPKFDEELWATLPDNHIVVGGKSMPREDWLNQFRERWGVKQEQIDSYKLETARKLKATVCIAKYVLKWKRKRSAKQKKMKRAKTFPIVNGH
jgi:tetratricopeptide (TPR) repeat protein